MTASSATFIRPKAEKTGTRNEIVNTGDRHLMEAQHLLAKTLKVYWRLAYIWDPVLASGKMQVAKVQVGILRVEVRASM